MSEKKRGRTKARSGRRACKNFFNDPLQPTRGLMKCRKVKMSTCIAGAAIPSDWSILIVLSTLLRLPYILSIRKIASVACSIDFEESELISILDDCLLEFPNIQVLRKKQQVCLVNLAHGKDLFAILPTGFGESLIFQLFPRLAKAAMKSEMCSIVVVSPLVSVMRDQVEQLKQLGCSTAAIGLSEEYEEDEKAPREGKCNLFSEIKNL